MIDAKKTRARQFAYVDDKAEALLRTLKVAIRTSGKTKDKIAREAHVSRSVIERWVQGKEIPTIGNLISLAQILNVDISDSINFKWYHDLIDVKQIEQKIAKFNLTPRDIASMLNFAESYVSMIVVTCGLKYAPVCFIAELLEALDVIEQAQ